MHPRCGRRTRARRRTTSTALLAAALAAALLAGCAAPPAQSGLAISGFAASASDCGQEVPFTLTLTNASDRRATNVTVVVAPQGFPSHVVRTHDLGPGEAGPVAGSLSVQDRCGVADTIAVVVTARSDEGLEGQLATGFTA